MTSFPMERRPQLMLKDFLDGDLKSSCSSNGFRSFPRKPCETTVRRLIDLDLDQSTNSQFKLHRSRSSKAASNTISAIHKASEIVINAVKKQFQFSAVKSPSVFRRSISRPTRVEDEREKITTVKVKDILRWRSFRDLIEEKPPPLDLSSSNTTTGSTSSGSSSSNSSSSWCESDFTFYSENLPLWCGKNEELNCEEVRKKCLLEGGVGGYHLKLKATTGGTVDPIPKEELPCKEKEQQSPVSVLDFSFAEDEDPSSPLHQSLAYMQRREYMLMQNNLEFERLAELQPVNLEKDFQEEEEENEYEEKAKCLLSNVKATSSTKSCEANTDCLMLDFFRHELASMNQKGNEFDSKIVRVAKAWIHGEYDGSFEWEVDEKRYNYIRDMERGVVWSKFREEHEELALEIEIGILNNLMDEILVDL